MRSAKARLVVKTVVLTIAGMVLIAVLASAIIVRAGWYDVGAITQHWQVAYSGMEAAMRYSVRHQAREVVAPPFTEPMVLRGAAVYEQHCLQCHGAPGIAPNGIGLSMQPVPGPLVHMMRRWTTAQVYWIISNGVKMTGMPAWRTRLSDDDVWAVTAFVVRLPALSKQDYAALAVVARAVEPVAVAPARADGGRDYAFTAVSAARGRVAIPQYGCQSCHVIPGIVGGRVAVGPPLDHYGARLYIAGHLPNTPENLVRWLRSPDVVKPQTTMPNLGLDERDAADIAAYLLGPK